MGLSNYLRRSGVAIVMIADHLNWSPKNLFLVGVGCYHKEIEVMETAWPGLNFVGFEPHPATFSGLKQEKLPGKVFEYAICNVDGAIVLYAKDRHKDGSSLFEIEGTTRSYRVNARKLDTLYDPPQEETLLWLDCEGSELLALQGASRFLQGVSVVNVEMTANPFTAGEGWCKPNEVHDELERQGFYQLHIHTHRTSAGQYDAVYVRPHLFDERYCCNVHEVARFRKGEKDVSGASRIPT